MVSDLLPVATEAPLCSAFSRQLGVGPAGTGLSLDRVLVVATPLPWPKPALNHPRVKSAAQALAGSPVPSRLFAAEPWNGVDDGVAVELYERGGGEFGVARWTVADEFELTELVGWIAETPLGGLVPAPSGVESATMLVCTQGSHDACCGIFGEELAARIGSEHPEIELRRVSHTGGHRFAPTLLALPSGRMWAYVDDALVARIAAGETTAADLDRHCRGWLGAPAGAGQVAEIAAQVTFRNEPDAGSSSPATIERDGDRWMVRIADTTVVVEVRPGRSVPTIACESPGGLPAKPSTEYEWRVVEPAR